MLFLALVSFRNTATRTITGHVYDANDKNPIIGVSVTVEGEKAGVSTDANGYYSIKVQEGGKVLSFAMVGYETKKVKIAKLDKLDVQLVPSNNVLSEVVVIGYGTQERKELSGAVSTVAANEVLQGKVAGVQIRGHSSKRVRMPEPVYRHNESYKEITENRFLKPSASPLSTFAIDVDNASYSNVRRFINAGQLPPKDAVRIEEMINYFKYDLPGPQGDDPVAIHTELASAPWNPKHQLARVGLKAKEIETERLPASNLVFLIDVSGSMAPENRLPLVKTSLKMLVDQLREKDKVAIVTYAGNAGLQLEATPGSQKDKIKTAIDGLGAGGSTAGGAGLKLAYQIARENFIPGGNNRIVLATDGDFNVGVSSDQDMEQLIVKERESGINISVLGYGMGNLKDSKMETIANKGRGNYAYIDNLTEARKAIVSEFGGTFFTIAKDVKVQVEFNPAKVQAYRLIGYENRLLAKEDFNNDKKIGGDMGVGHTVTALYELIPAGVKSSFTDVNPLKYQQESQAVRANSSEVATVKFRYKHPQSNKSKLQQVVVEDRPLGLSKTSNDFRFASAVAELGMLLRDSEFKQEADFEKLIARAKAARGADEEGYRAEFVRLAETVRLLSKSNELARD